MTLGRKLLLSLLLVALLGAGFFGWHATRSGPADVSPAAPTAEQVAQKAWAFYASRDPYERPKPWSKTPEGLGNMNAATCGACHTEIYEEWQLSTHRRAWGDDAQFQEELKKSRGIGDPSQGDVGWLCVNCHTPMMNQQEQWVVGLEGGEIHKPLYQKNPDFDPAFQDDAITCATCHVKDGMVLGPYGEGGAAPHPVRKDPDLLTEKVCTQCHQAEATYPARNLACFFSTGREWAASDYAKTGQTCQSCHMPEIDRKVAPAFDVPVRKTRRHWFGGSLIPKKPEYEAEIAPLRKVYGSGVSFKVRALAKGQPVPQDVAFKTPCPQGQACRVVLVDVVNDRAGHAMPSGDPERHIIVDLEATSAGEKVAAGQALFGTRYEWWPKIKLLSDTRIMPGQTSTVALAVPTTEAFSLRVEATKWRMYKDAFEHHHLEGKYVRGRVFHRSSWSVKPESKPEAVWVKDDLTGGL